ncbi:MAG TPA: glycoside hydrolase family 5 protein [Ktedonobacteraceae bacterium]
MRMLHIRDSRVIRILRVIVLATILLFAPIATVWHASIQCQPRTPVGFLHSFGSELVDEAGCDIHLTGVNWFGFETSSFAPHGLETRNWQDMLNQIKKAGFDTMRLPFSNQLFDPSSKPQGINYRLNPDLKGLQGLALMDRIIQGARGLGLRIILDRHDTTADFQSELWYTDQVTEARWIHDWVMLAQHYRGNDTVIGADLANEPRGPATWGDGNPRTDWRLAAERAGNAILKVNPDWLIIVEGIEQYHGDYYWWGGNLEGAGQFPVELAKPNKLVYSAHDYGPEIYKQSWFRAPNYPHNLPGVWQQHWAYLQMENIAPVLLGEFGGRSVGTDPAGVWQRSLVVFLHEQGISYTYWAWNPDSGDTGGILQNNWTTVNQSKLHILSIQRQSRLDQQHSSPKSHSKKR